MFTIPTSPMVFEGKESENENIEINFEETSNCERTFLYTYNTNFKRWYGAGDDDSIYRLINKYDAANYGFYVSSSNNYKHYLELYHPIARKLLLHTLDIRKYKFEQSDGDIKNFPSDTSIDVQSNGVSSGSHTISLTLDREIYNQFETVYMSYGLYGMDRITLAEDNVSPSIELEGEWDEELSAIVIRNISVDSTGNFITIFGTPFDVGNNLPAMVPVDITIIKDDGSFNETISAVGDTSKYLNIPIGHLENETYELSISFKYIKGNGGNCSLAHFLINREPVSDKVKIIKTGENKFTINAEESDAEKYALSCFDETENLWKPFETSGDVNAPAEYEKNGFFQLHLNNPDREFRFYNNFKYHYLFYFPEEKVMERDFQLWRNSIRINTDKPFFIHFIKSDTDWGKDVDAWEGHQSYSYSINDNSIFIPYYEDLFAKDNRKFYENIKGCSSPYTGNEINSCAVNGDYTVTPYVCQIPWEQLDKKYAAAVIIWADNKKDLILLDTSLR